MDIDKMLSLCKKCKYLPENELKQLCDRICDILISESNVQPVNNFNDGGIFSINNSKIA